MWLALAAVTLAAAIVGNLTFRPIAFMLNDLMTAFLVAFAAVTASGLLTRIWEFF